MRCVTCEGFDKRYLLGNNKIVAIPLEDTMGFLINNKYKVCRYNSSLCISFLRKCNFRSFLPTRFDLNYSENKWEMQYASSSLFYKKLEDEEQKGVLINSTEKQEQHYSLD
ncbi:DnaJ-like protein subfamily B member 1 [Senna tora]|uniref:DnaJ-like protein subfamily B member 1 n=1 Tax=Senna tora TaxID=362788 RepID=A0A834XK75_9FABA|nr:DnaJ-like protein subfamily B member 1 [Senna tora]